MKIEITANGIFGANGEIPVGTVLDVKDEPKGWDGRYRVVSEGGKMGKTPVINPATQDAPGSDDVKTPAEVLAMADGNFMAFKSAASKLLGDTIPSKKDEIIAALEELATKPE